MLVTATRRLSALDRRSRVNHVNHVNHVSDSRVSDMIVSREVTRYVSGVTHVSIMC